MSQPQPDVSPASSHTQADEKLDVDQPDEKLDVDQPDEKLDVDQPDEKVERSGATNTPDAAVSELGDDDTFSYSTGPPPLNYTLRTHGRERYIIILFTLLFVEAGVLPLILFYSLRWGAHLSVTKNLAIITSLIGTVSGLKIAQRTLQLWFRTGHESRRPIGSSRWGVDTFHVLIGVAMWAFFVPLIIGSSLTPASVPVVSMALPLVMLTFGIPMFITGAFDRRLRLPFRVSSLPANSPLPPLTYTIVEDVIAVDGGGGLAFRHAWAHRYQTSVIIRRVCRNTSLLWGLSGTLIGIALVIAGWLAPTDTAYGLGYGIPWLWAMLCTAATIVYVHHMLIKEEREWSNEGENAVHKDVQLQVQLTGDEADREVERMAHRALRQKRRGDTTAAVLNAANTDGVAERDFASSSSSSGTPTHTPPPRTPATV